LSVGTPPRGISRFPDGGSHNLLFKKVTLYRYNIAEGDLIRIYDLGEIPSNAGSWRNDISWHDNKIAFSNSPLSGWDWMIGHSTNTQYSSLKENLSGIFIYDPGKNSVTKITDYGIEPAISPDGNQLAYLVVDSIKTVLYRMNLATNETQQLTIMSEIDSYPPTLHWVDQDHLILKSGKDFSLFSLGSRSLTEPDLVSEPDLRIIDQGEIKNITNKITFQDWGLSLESVWPRNKKEYIRDVIHLNGNFNYRKAIIEKIGQHLNAKEVEQMIEEMNKYQDSLEGSEKMNYEIFSEETRELLHRLLQKMKT
jgi:hypothetical protein